jgi:hypothetical protein
MTDLLACRAFVLEALNTECRMRPKAKGLEWIDNERLAVTVAANKWATAHGYRTVTVDDVERVEGMAVGHYDYTSKFALAVAELVVDGAA